MRTIFIVILMAMSLASKAQSTADDTAIREALHLMEEGWAKKDGNLFAKPFAENADYVIINGMYISGKKLIGDAHQNIFNTIYKETFVKIETKSIRYLRPDIAIVHVNAHMTGKLEGKEVDSRGTISVTMEKTGSGWEIASFQNTPVGPHTPSTK